MRKLVRKSVLPFSFLPNHKMSLLLWGFKFFSSSAQHCFSILFPPIGFYATRSSSLHGSMSAKTSKKIFFFGPMCSCMPIDHRSGINGRDDCLWLKINHLSHSSDKKWKAPWTIFRCAALLAQIRKKMVTAVTALKLPHLRICWTNFGYAKAEAEIFPWKQQKINELQKPSA